MTRIHPFFTIIAVSAAFLPGRLHAQPKDETDPAKIRTAVLGGRWDATLSGRQGTRGIVLVVDGADDTINIGGQDLKLTRDGAAIHAKGSTRGMIHVLDGQGAIETKIELAVKSLTVLSGTFEVRRGTEILDQGTIEASRKAPEPPKERAPRLLTPEEKLVFEPNPPPELAKVISEFPGDELYRHGVSWVNNGPIFYRGRVDGTAKVMVIASDPGPDEAIVRRPMVGATGKWVQGFLAKIGVRESAVLANAHAYAIPSSKSKDEGLEILQDPKMTAWRNRYYDELIKGAPIQAIFALGFSAQEAVKLWSSRPSVPVIFLPHPSHMNDQIFRRYKAIAEQFRKGDVQDFAGKVWKIAISPDPGMESLPGYGATWTKSDYAGIPRSHLPFNALPYAGAEGLGNFATRPADDLWGTEILVRAPHRSEEGLPPLKRAVSRGTSGPSPTTQILKDRVESGVRADAKVTER